MLLPLPKRPNSCELYQMNYTTMMLLRMQLSASLLLVLAIHLCSSSAVYHDYIVVGAGPGGLQLGYFLERAGRDYVILERGVQAGTVSPLFSMCV